MTIQAIDQMRRKQARQISSSIRSMICQDEALGRRYQRAKETVRAFRRPAFYEIETRCNLKCEGCYYFEGGDTWKINGDKTLDEWKLFFRQEAERGVSMAYFVGAEPALAQERLLAAAEHFPWGNIGTNGTIRLHKDIPYRIGVSVWAGDDAADIQLRGASVFRKALANYEGDKRAIMLLTVSRETIHQVPEVARLCREHGVELTYNLYSPTHSFLNKLASDHHHDDRFFRFSDRSNSPVFADSDWTKVRDILAGTIEDYPETVAYCQEYNDHMCQPGSRYQLDESGIALDCQSRITDPMRYYTTDLEAKSVKCCTPDIDCSQCRMYSGGWSSRFIPTLKDVATPKSFTAWLNMIDTLGRIFLYPLPEWLSSIEPLGEKE